MRKELQGLLCVVLCFVFSLICSAYAWSQANTIKIGFNLPLTGQIPKVGENSRNAAEMLKDQLNAFGGLKVGDEYYGLEFFYEDNETKADSTVIVTLRLIADDGVLGIIGPQASVQAIPVGEICDAHATPMISAWSTHPATTKDRPYVFRACFIDTFQAPVAANFVTEEFGAKTAAVLYDIQSDYPRGLAKFFKNVFEELHGKGSVVAFEAFTTGEEDFSSQLTTIINSNADVLFVPQYYQEVPLIVKQAHNLGWNKPIMGSDSWGSGDLVELCGDDCKGLFFSTHYTATGATGATKEFIEVYTVKYGHAPDDVAALTWDATRLMLTAIQNTGGLSEDLAKDRDAVKDQLAKITDFDGVTGKMTFTPEGDPLKCAVIVKINDQGEFEFYKSVCP